MPTYRSQIIFAAVTIIIAITFSNSSHVSAQWEENVDEHLQLVGGIGGIAVETYLDGRFSGTIATVRIYPDFKRIEKINFMFGPPGRPDFASTSVDHFVISSVQKVDPQKYVFKGKNDSGYDFVASYSLIDRKFSFNLLIEGRGRVEVRQLGPNGLALKNKYLRYLDLGYVAK